MKLGSNLRPRLACSIGSNLISRSIPDLKSGLEDKIYFKLETTLDYAFRNTLWSKLRDELEFSLRNRLEDNLGG